MRILIVASFSPSLRNFRGPLIKAWLRAGHEVHAAAPDLLCNCPTREWLEIHDVICHDIPLARVGMNPLVDLYTLIALKQLMRQIAPDVFLGYTAKPVVWGLIAARFIRVRHRVALITGLGYFFTKNPGRSPGFSRILLCYLYRLALRFATLVFFQNQDDFADFRRIGLLPNGIATSVVAGSGIDLAHFSVRPLTPGPVKFLLIARLLASKGIREYIAAAKMIRRIYSEAEFHLVGGLDAQNPAAIPESEILAAHAASEVIWHGHLDDVRPILSQVSCYVLPSYREGTPRTVLEAMATGRPIITTDAPGCRETVIDGVNGFLVPPCSIEALAAAMFRWIELPESDRQRMANASTQLAYERFDVHKVNAQMLAAMGL
jgi:glycosyltransferase involved in cell wall biosynthesis